jgi:glycosyltransferase involved in cell wall biosynthesis
MDRSTKSLLRRSSRSLFITYDGLLDPLGASQILPYLTAIASQEENMHILSFEKIDRFRSAGHILRSELTGTTISWTPLLFTCGWGALGKVWDLLCMHVAAIIIAIRLKPSIVHCRSHAPAQVGLLIKKIFGASLLFDFRGLWVDERVDKGGWSLGNPWHRMQFRYYKRIERMLLQEADHVVVLTEAVLPEVLRLGVHHRNHLTVIPCCADFSHFQLVTPESRLQARSALGIPEQSFVLGYLGSVGGMYLPERFLKLLALAAGQDPQLHALILTPDCHAFHKLMHQHLPPHVQPCVHTHCANRQQVARWLPAMDLLVSFIKPSYARMGSSPTKLAEAWACGIPALCNSGVGDVAQLVSELHAGMVIDADSDQELQAAAKALPTMVAKAGTRLREAALARLSLELASSRYLGIYHLLRS